MEDNRRKKLFYKDPSPNYETEIKAVKDEVVENKILSKRLRQIMGVSYLKKNLDHTLRDSV